MKLFATVSFLLAFLLLTVNALAQVQHYGVEASIEEGGRSFVKLTITFVEPETVFNFNIIGKVENFNATSIAGPIDCYVQSGGISYINCNLSLTKEKRMIKLSFETNDFVKIIDDKFFFDSDLSLNKDIAGVFVFIKLPQTMRLTSENLTAGRLSFPENATTITEGRHIIINWKLSDIKSDQSLRFQFLYERITQPPMFYISLRHFAVFGIAAAGAIGFIYMRYFRKPEKLVLSVLDDYERKVIGIITASEGAVNQKKVVKETNLSKAKVSRVVKNLVKRGLIEVERVGRTNKLKLVKKKFKI